MRWLSRIEILRPFIMTASFFLKLTKPFDVDWKSFTRDTNVSITIGAMVNLLMFIACIRHIKILKFHNHYNDCHYYSSQIRKQSENLYRSYRSQIDRYLVKNYYVYIIYR